MADDTAAPKDDPCDAELEEWYRMHDGRENGEPAGLGISRRGIGRWSVVHWESP
jgi:hypothetical protein